MSKKSFGPGPNAQRSMRKTVFDRLRDLCNEQGVDPAAPLTEEEIKKWMYMTHAEKNMLRLITEGYPVRNAQTIAKLIMEKTARAVPPPKTDADPQNIQVTIKSTMADRMSAALPEGVVAMYADEIRDMKIDELKQRIQARKDAAAEAALPREPQDDED